MRQPQPERAGDARSKRSDAATSSRPGGGRQVEQEPARGRSMGTNVAAGRPDKAIRADLDALLAGADDFDPEQVQLLVADGVVVMMGSVPDYGIKRRLDQQCSQIDGVHEIHDQLLVDSDGSSTGAGGLRGDAPRAGFRGRSG